jgi:hypothetical protein
VARLVSVLLGGERAVVHRVMSCADLAHLAARPREDLSYHRALPELAERHTHTRLVSHLRARGHLVVADAVQVHPLNSVSARHDRSVLERDLHEWRTGNRDITVELH